MLKSNHYYIQNIESLKDFITVIFVIIDDIYNQKIPYSIKNRLHKDIAILSDSEIITISIVGELLSIDSEKAWVSYVSKNLKDLFPKMCERSRFNRTQRNLMTVTNEISKQLNLMVESFSSKNRIVDSFPLPVCKFGRAHFHKTFQYSGASYGKCASKKEIYYGYKVHVLTTFEGYITDFIITKASVDDRQAVWDLIENYNNPLLITGDKGYISESLSKELQTKKDSTLIYMKRNSTKYEILYIGQAYGKMGERTAIERLSSHSTLQKILTDCQGKYSDRYIYILLLEMEPMLFISCDGLNKKYTKSNEEDNSHIKMVLSNLPYEQQVINITEAAMINYFKPPYNKNFVENFPDENHKGYTQYFSLDYNKLSVEISLKFEKSPLVQLYTDNSRISSSHIRIEYSLYNNPNRKDMYDIFG